MGPPSRGLTACARRQRRNETPTGVSSSSLHPPPPSSTLSTPPRARRLARAGARARETATTTRDASRRLVVFTPPTGTAAFLATLQGPASRAPYNTPPPSSLPPRSCANPSEPPPSALDHGRAVLRAHARQHDAAAFPLAAQERNSIHAHLHISTAPLPQRPLVSH
ncbi:hypothetical protein PLICRDRAFT_174227 [Plicaturopsis crispa FD-325 SS-3]|nr:hypothetical protein PLICRDRAFT_174227 [Plicaturopsis crispa FD-325 SS-3]